MGINNSGKFNKSFLPMRWFKSIAYWSKSSISVNLTFGKQNKDFVVFA